MHKRLLEVSPTTPKEELRNTIRATVLLVKKALLDNVFYVSNFLTMNVSWCEKVPPQTL